MKKEVTIKDLLEAGAHFGHQRRRWNPKMERFVIEQRHGLTIIDLAKTKKLLEDAIKVVEKTVDENKSILFVGTKKQAKTVIQDSADACGEFYICERWLGGTLTNIDTIRRSVKTLEKIEHQIVGGGEGLTKKELSLLAKKLDKLERNLSGVRSMRKLPGLLVVVDPNQEHIAVKEAKKLGIPVLALVDTNCDPDPIDYIIPCNDDALKSVKLIIQSLTQAIIDKKNALDIAIETGSKEVENEKVAP